PLWLSWARELQRELDRSFWSTEFGGYFTAAESEKGLIVRKVDRNDGALPSPNSVSYGNLIRLAQYFVDPSLDERASELFEAHGTLPEGGRMAVPALLLGLKLRAGEGPRLLVVSGISRESAQKEMQKLRQKFLPDLLLAHAGEGVSEIPVLE